MPGLATLGPFLPVHGYVTFLTMGGHMGAPTLYAMGRWMESEGKRQT